MCWATPSSCESSPMVLRAPGAFSAVATWMLPGDPIAHDLASAEGHHSPGGDRHLDSRLRVSAHALSLVAQDEGSEAGNLHVVPFGKRVAHVVKNALDQAGAFSTRQAELAMHDVGQVGTSQSAVGFSVIGDPRDAEIGHKSSPALFDPAPATSIHYRNKLAVCRQFDIQRISEFFQYLSAAAPHVKPPPIASSTTMSPCWILPSLTALSKASGTDAADVLACSSTVTTTFSDGRPSFFAVASRIRALAWCGTTQSTSAEVRPAAASTSLRTSARLTTAWRKTSRPFMRSFPTVPVVE